MAFCSVVSMTCIHSQKFFLYVFMVYLFIYIFTMDMSEKKPEQNAISLEPCCSLTFLNT